MASDYGDLSHANREAQQERRAKRLPGRVEQLLDMKKEGFKIVELSPYQFRVNDVLDIYPIHHRYHDLKKNRRGGFGYIPTFINKFFNK